MADYGFGPFLWINREPWSWPGVGGSCCSAGSACGDHPLSEELLADFTRWMREFEAAPRRYSADVPIELALNWGSFHEIGIGLARRLKAEVGDTWRVVYRKPMEDPEYHVNRCREVTSGNDADADGLAQI